MHQPDGIIMHAANLEQIGAAFRPNREAAVGCSYPRPVLESLQSLLKGTNSTCRVIKGAQSGHDCKILTPNQTDLKMQVIPGLSSCNKLPHS